ILRAITAAATKSTTRQNGGHHRVFATKCVRCCQVSLSPWPTSAMTMSHGADLIATADMMTNAEATSTSTATTIVRPSATASPMYTDAISTTDSDQTTTGWSQKNASGENAWKRPK